MSNPSSASRGSCALTPMRPPHDRGNSSYQLPNLARHAVDLDRDRVFEGDAAMPRLDPLEGREQLGSERDVVFRRLGDLVVGQRGRGVPDQCLVGVVRGRLLGALEQQDTLGQLAGEVVLMRGDLALELVAPGAEHVGPGLDRVLPMALAIDVECAGPADAPEVGVDPEHLSFLVLVVFGVLVADDRAKQVVAVTEDVGLDGYGVADAAFGGVATTIDGRRRVLDDDAGRRARLAVRAPRRGARLDFSGCCSHGQSRWTDAVDGRVEGRAVDGTGHAAVPQGGYVTSENIRLRDG